MNNPWVILVSAVILASVSSALDNGLALTPPMGWLSWERFQCNTDCVNDPENCISEHLMKTMADLMVSEGYAEAGYKYIIVDDCWLARERDTYGRLQADPQRFPSGIKGLADYVHSKGLLFGIYEDYGDFTCAGYPGVLGHLEVDAYTLASWGVDYIKLDGCHSDPKDMDQGYPEFGHYLNRTGRPIVYSCSWPQYQMAHGIQPNYTAIRSMCNLWRNYGDIEDSWGSVLKIVDYYGDNQESLVPNAGPGHWNDPDMLIIGDFGLSYEESKVQMALWAILAAPLLMSVDLRTIRPEYKAILQNSDIIQVSQDPLGIQGKRIFRARGIEIWARPVTPVIGRRYSYAVAFVNRRTDGTPTEVSVTLQEIGMDNPSGYRIRDLFAQLDLGVLLQHKKMTVEINPSGVVMLRCVAQPIHFFNQNELDVKPSNRRAFSHFQHP